MGKTGGSVYFGGIPTGPDVKKLIDAFELSKMVPGYTIPYSEVEKIIEQQSDSNRWRSVTDAWRKKVERDYGIFIGCDSVKSNDDSEEYEKVFCILTEGGKVELTGKKLRTAVRSAKRSYVIAGSIDVKKLSDDQKKTYDFNRLTSANIMATAQLRSGKNLLPEMTEK